MSFLGNMFKGGKGMGWEAERGATTAQANEMYGNVQQGLRGQQDFLQALQGQRGLANQSSVFSQQQGLADLMQGVATGTGPNPALAQLQQTTGQNIAATTAAMTGARGAGSNPALMARSAARQGAQTQQDATAQAAVLAAQQQIAGMDALSRQQQAMGNMANTQVANQAAATNAFSTAAQNAQANILASINAQNQANAAMQSKVAEGQMGLVGGILQGLGSAAQMGMGKPAATGGKVRYDRIGSNPRYLAEGGLIQEDEPKTPEEGGTEDLSKVKRTSVPDIFSGDIAANSGGDSLRMGLGKIGEAFGTGINRMGAGKKSSATSMLPTGPATTLPATGGPASSGIMVASKGGKVPALLSPGEKYLTPEQAQDVLKGKENPLNGKTIPGKAVKKGDSYDNDVVPATLEEGGCVIPRSVLQSDQPMKNAIKFVHQHMKKMAKGGKVEHKNEKAKQHNEEQVPMHVASEVLKNPHVIFSPSNPLFDKTLDMTPDEVLDMLKSKGLIAEAAMGKYGQAEPSIIVHNVQPHHVPFLFDLAKQLGQESAILSANGKHEGHYLNGPNTGKVARGMGTAIHSKEPENFYTKTKNGLIFSHDIDWDNLHDK